MSEEQKTVRATELPPGYLLPASIAPDPRRTYPHKDSPSND